MSATLDLPLTTKRLKPEEVLWLLTKSAQTGKSTDEVIKDLISRAAKGAITPKKAA